MYNTPNYLLFDPPLLVAASFLLTHTTYVMPFGVI
jgi:hypothetical protein